MVPKDMITMGIDPGVFGAIATSEGWVESLPIIGPPRKRRLDAEGLSQLVAPDLPQISFCLIEQYDPRPMEGRVSVATGAILFGSLHTWLQVNHIRFEEVPPARWKRALSLIKKGAKKKDLKEMSLSKALWLFPGSRNAIIGPQGGKDHNKAEALLLAHYAYRLMTGEPEGGDQ